MKYLTGSRPEFPLHIILHDFGTADHGNALKVGLITLKIDGDQEVDPAPF